MNTEATTRKEHLDWCKQRALEYVESGDFTNALASMVSDLDKHPGTQGHIGIALGVMQQMAGRLSAKSDVRKWVEGFN